MGQERQGGWEKLVGSDTEGKRVEEQTGEERGEGGGAARRV
jgi:hypothetical protein